VDGNLVAAPGHAELLRRLDYPSPTHVIGWSLCEQRPFRPSTDTRRVLFAPAHPGGDGSLFADERQGNQRAYRELLATGCELTVRHIGPLEFNGLWAAPGVRFIAGDFLVDHTEIDVADVVVASAGTFPALSVARGVPTVIFYQDRDPSADRSADSPYSRSSQPRLARYGDYMRFPFDLGDGPADEVLHAAARGAAEIAPWRRRFIGDPLDPVALADDIIVRAAAPQLPSLGESRSVTVVAFADEIADRPQLLREFARRYGPDDDATLLLYAPGWTGPTLLRVAQDALAACGLDDDTPDILLVPVPGTPQVEALIARRAGAVLSDWPAVGPIGTLPRFAGGDVALAAAA
jgi:hypothetical protein